MKSSAAVTLLPNDISRLKQFQVETYNYNVSWCADMFDAGSHYSQYDNYVCGTDSYIGIDAEYCILRKFILDGAEAQVCEYAASRFDLEPTEVTIPRALFLSKENLTWEYGWMLAMYSAAQETGTPEKLDQQYTPNDPVWLAVKAYLTQNYSTDI